MTGLKSKLLPLVDHTVVKVWILILPNKRFPNFFFKKSTYFLQFTFHLINMYMLKLLLTHARDYRFGDNDFFWNIKGSRFTSILSWVCFHNIFEVCLIIFSLEWFSYHLFKVNNCVHNCQFNVIKFVSNQEHN